MKRKQAKGTAKLVKALEGTCTQFLHIMEMSTSFADSQNGSMSLGALHEAVGAISRDIVSGLREAGFEETYSKEAEQIAQACRHVNECDYTLEYLVAILDELADSKHGCAAGRMAYIMSREAAREVGRALIALTGNDAIGFTEETFGKM